MLKEREEFRVRKGHGGMTGYLKREGRFPAQGSGKLKGVVVVASQKPTERPDGNCWGGASWRRVEGRKKNSFRRKEGGRVSKVEVKKGSISHRTDPKGVDVGREESGTARRTWANSRRLNTEALL